MKELRADRNGPHRVAFEKNKKILLKTQNTCGICGQPVDKSLRYPHPLSPVIDHIIPVNKNGHPSDIKNLQIAHWQCNRQKSDKLYAEQNFGKNTIVGNRNLPQSTNWLKYHSCPRADRGGYPLPSVLAELHAVTVHIFSRQIIELREVKKCL